MEIYAAHLDPLQTRWVMAVAVLLTVSVGVVSALGSVNPVVPAPPRTLHEQQLVIDKYGERRKREIDELLTTARETINKPGRQAEAALAIRLLGRMRAAEAID